jgi:hypothetical protein
MRHESDSCVSLGSDYLSASVVSASERDIKFRLVAATMAITPKPEPPLVTTSPEVFLSLARPLTG